MYNKKLVPFFLHLIMEGDAISYEIICFYIKELTQNRNSSAPQHISPSVASRGVSLPPTCYHSGPPAQVHVIVRQADWQDVAHVCDGPRELQQSDVVTIRLRHSKLEQRVEDFLDDPGIYQTY